MAITPENVRKVAKLARLKLTEDEITKYNNEINKIMKWIDQLQEIDTANIEPMTGTGHASLRFCEDVVSDGNIQEAVLKNAPSSRYGYFVVPKVVE